MPGVKMKAKRTKSTQISTQAINVFEAIYSLEKPCSTRKIPANAEKPNFGWTTFLNFLVHFKLQKEKQFWTKFNFLNFPIIFLSFSTFHATIDVTP